MVSLILYLNLSNSNFLAPMPGIPSLPLPVARHPVWCHMGQVSLWPGPVPGTPGRRISSDRVMPRVMSQWGICRQCVEVLIRIESRWGAAWIQGPQGRGGGQQRAGQRQESDGGCLHYQECECSVRGAGPGPGVKWPDKSSINSTKLYWSLPNNFVKLR